MVSFKQGRTMLSMCFFIALMTPWSLITEYLNGLIRQLVIPWTISYV